MKCPSFIPVSASNPRIIRPLSAASLPRIIPPDNGGSDELVPRSTRTADWHIFAPCHGATGDPSGSVQDIGLATKPVGFRSFARRVALRCLGRMATVPVQDE